jgi:signal transduction histidine kinase
MTRTTIISILTLLLLSSIPTPSRAQYAREYTEEHPLIIASDWEFPPYEFRNDNGEPDGYNVDVLNLVLDKLGIPHRFVMQEWYQAVKTFENREADLIHALSGIYRQHPYAMTQNMITYYPLKTVRRKSQEPLTKISQLNPGDTLMAKKNDYAPVTILGGEHHFTLEYRSPKEALTSIRSGRNSYYIWGELPLKMKIREFALDSLVLDDIDIPAGELRIIGYDQKLIADIDDAYARLEQSGDLEVLHDKWYYPERIHNDSSPVSLLALAIAILAIIIGFALSRLIQRRVRNASVRTSDINGMMSQALKMGSLFVTEFDVEKGCFRNIYGNLLPEGGLTREEMSERLPEELREESKRRHEGLISGESDLWNFTRRFNLGTPDHPEWHYIQGNAVPEKEKGKTRYIIYTQKDITREIEEERINSEIGNKYLKMFETNLIAMSFYDAQGYLIDLNNKMKELCEFNADGERYFRQQNLFTAPLFKEQFDSHSADEFHACQKMQIGDVSIKKYIEVRIRPTFDNSGELRYYVVTARDLTDERKLYLEQRRHEQEIQESNDAVVRYESQLNYLLENSNMFIFDYNIQSNRINYTRTSLQKEYSETLEEFFNGISDERRRRKALAEIRACVGAGLPYNAIHLYDYTPIENKPVWYSISGVPRYDKEGRMVSYFGIARNITRLMETQKQLKEETARAEDSGKMKAAFLANMTHEIRTPLNAIVGFSDLLPMVDTKEERLEFIRIIRNNCDMLMRLINDILEASTMGQALAIEAHEVEFATAFDDLCQTLAQRVQQPGVEFIKDNPYQHYVTTLDLGRVQQVLVNFVTNAVKYTQQGHIKVGYRHEVMMTKDELSEADGLYFYCEDTGAGIPKEKQASVFERFVKLDDFVQGTGLGLSICQAIADRCNGHIGVTSEGEGKGSTFWMWIPCKHPGGLV